jgi:hypothetical protein
MPTQEWGRRGVRYLMKVIKWLFDVQRLRVLTCLRVSKLLQRLLCLHQPYRCLQALTGIERLDMLDEPGEPLIMTHCFSL